MKNGSCVSGCGSNYYSNQNNICVACTTNCAVCNKNSCITCDSGLTVQADRLTCATGCPTGFQIYNEPGTTNPVTPIFCQACQIPFCQRCNDVRTITSCDVCVSTPVNYKLNYDDRSCVATCGESLYETTENTAAGLVPKCQLCYDNQPTSKTPGSNSCSDCDDDGKCLRCKSGFFLNLADNYCYSVCPSKTY